MIDLGVEPIKILTEGYSIHLSCVVVPGKHLIRYQAERAKCFVLVSQ